jgi:ABC-type transport system involved in multi-copper enzyme maturation permease subunit
MVGPVLNQEMLIGTRRSRLHLFRWLYGGWLLLQVFLFSLTAGLPAALNPKVNSSAAIRLAADLTPVLIAQQIILVFLVTPVFTASAITEEKTRGTLQYLLTTDLSSWHILVGKMLARLAQVGLVAVTGLPLLFFFGPLAGLSFFTLLASVLVSIIPLFWLASLSLLASVWTKQTRDAVLVFFLVLGLHLIILAIVGGANYIIPTNVLKPIMEGADSQARAEFGRRLTGMILLWGGEGFIWLSLATLSLRPAYIRQLQGDGRARKNSWWRSERSAIGEKPIIWKERQVDGLSPIQYLRGTPTWVGVIATFLATLGGSLFILWLSLPSGVSIADVLGMLKNRNYPGFQNQFGPADEGFQLMGVLVMLLFSLLVGVRCSGAISGERERQTWEALLLTPLSAKSLIRGKLWGIMGASYYYLFAYAVPALALSLIGGLMSFLWVAIGLGVTLLAMYFIGATGLRCSVRAKNSWRSLLGTLGVGYIGGFIVFAMTSPIVGILAGIIYLVMQLTDHFFNTALLPSATGGGITGVYFTFKIASCVGLALIFWLMSKFFLHETQKWVAERERTRHWFDEPQYYRAKKHMKKRTD